MGVRVSRQGCDLVQIWPLYWSVYVSSDVIWFGNLTKDVIWLAFANVLKGGGDLARRMAALLCQLSGAIIGNPTAELAAEVTT